MRDLLKCHHSRSSKPRSKQLLWVVPTGFYTLNGQCPFKIIFFVDVVSNRARNLCSRAIIRAKNLWEFTRLVTQANIRANHSPLAGNYSCLPSYTTPDMVVIHITTGVPHQSKSSQLNLNIPYVQFLDRFKQIQTHLSVEEPAGLQLHHSNSATAVLRSRQFSCTILLAWIASSLK